MKDPIPPKKIAHIGIAVQSIEKTIPFYTKHLGLELEKIEDVHSEQVKVAFLKIGETRIELLEPLNHSSAIYTFLQKKGEGIHHLAFGVNDLTSRLSEVRSEGIKLIKNEAKKGENKRQIFFLHPLSDHGV